jgi:hypothetical protein
MISMPDSSSASCMKAAAVGVSVSRLLQNLAKNVPGFVEYFCEEQGIDLAAEQRGTLR